MDFGAPLVKIQIVIGVVLLVAQKNVEYVPQDTSFKVNMAVEHALFVLMMVVLNVVVEAKDLAPLAKLITPWMKKHKPVSPVVMESIQKLVHLHAQNVKMRIATFAVVLDLALALLAQSTPIWIPTNVLLARKANIRRLTLMFAQNVMMKTAIAVRAKAQDNAASVLQDIFR